jgi:hypothetical protein
VPEREPANGEEVLQHLQHPPVAVDQVERSIGADLGVGTEREVVTILKGLRSHGATSANEDRHHPSATIVRWTESAKVVILLTTIPLSSRQLKNAGAALISHLRAESEGAVTTSPPADRAYTRSDCDASRN